MVKEILKPRSIREAVGMGSRAGAAYLGGGTWLNARHAPAPSLLVSLENLGLSSIVGDASLCEMGAMATFQQARDDARVPEAVRAALSFTASRILRNMATIGGELGFKPEDSALIPVLIALEAEVRLAGKRKPVAVEEYVRDRGKGLVLSVLIKNASRRACLVDRLSRTSHAPRSLVIAMSAILTPDSIRDARAVASDCRGSLQRLAGVEALAGRPLAPKHEIEDAVRAEFSPRADIHASAPYKKYMAGVMASDLLHALAAKGGVS
jgi:putative selenate reductase FAD-binding subunit